MRYLGVVQRLAVGAALAVLETFAIAAAAPTALHPIPQVIQKDGHFGLLVDGKPYLMLGVQANNSSAWPDYLPKVWPAAETLHANTVELPVYWEQIEAVQGKFDFALVDLILKQAREHRLHLVDRKSTRLNSSHLARSRMPSSA